VELIKTFEVRYSIWYINHLDNQLLSVLWCCYSGIKKRIRPVKIEWWTGDVVICLQRGGPALQLQSTVTKVCLSVHSRNWKTTRLNITKFYTRVACGHGSVLLRRHCDTLSISGFVDDFKFLYHWDKGPESSTTLCFEVVGQVAVPGGRQTTTVFGRVIHNAGPGAKSAINDCLDWLILLNTLAAFKRVNSCICEY